MNQHEFQRLLAFFKALANESRLKIVGILANRECSVGDLADLLDLREPTVSHHLSILKDLGLVDMYADGNTHIYWLVEEALVQMNKDVFSPENVAELAQDLDEQSWEDKVLRTYVIDGRLAQIPTKRKKLLVILRWLADKFELDRRYPEAELNEIIKQCHPDYASLRRDMVDLGFMARDHGIYWRVRDAPPGWKDKVLQTFVVDGRLTAIPARRKKQIVVLEWLADRFDGNRPYTEPELNEIIACYHPDTASLRRELVGWKFLQREHGVYWRMPRKEQLAQLDPVYKDVIAVLSG
jgi:DNA-binding MarR family transcriptional regulator